MMNVINKDNNEKYSVYDITYNKRGYPHFLIYKDGEWLRMSAKHFRPFTVDDITNELGNCMKNMNRNSFLAV